MPEPLTVLALHPSGFEIHLQVPSLDALEATIADLLQAWLPPGAGGRWLAAYGRGGAYLSQASSPDETPGEARRRMALASGDRLPHGGGTVLPRVRGTQQPRLGAARVAHLLSLFHPHGTPVCAALGCVSRQRWDSVALACRSASAGLPGHGWGSWGLCPQTPGRRQSLSGVREWGGRRRSLPARSKAPAPLYAPVGPHASRGAWTGNGHEGGSGRPGGRDAHGR